MSPGAASSFTDLPLAYVLLPGRCVPVSLPFHKGYFSDINEQQTRGAP